MDIETRTHGFELTPALAERVEHHVRSALDPMSDRITRVTVRLDDLNGGTRGGGGKAGRVEGALSGPRPARGRFDRSRGGARRALARRADVPPRRPRAE